MENLGGLTNLYKTHEKKVQYVQIGTKLQYEVIIIRKPWNNQLPII